MGGSNLHPDGILTPRWTELRFHPEQSRLWKSTARFRMVVAGRGSGKTELAKRKIVMSLSSRIPGCQRPMYFIAGPTHSQIKRQYWDDIKAMIPRGWVRGRAMESTLHIRTIFGSELYLCGLDAPARIEGNQWCGGVVDESSDVKPGAFKLSIRPALSEFNGWCIRQGIPKRLGVGAAEFQKAWEDARSGRTPDSDAFWWESADILPPGEMMAVRSELSREDFDEQYRAQWVLTQGALFSSFSVVDSVRPCAYDPFSPIMVGCDFNVENMAWVLGHRKGEELEIFDMIWLHNINTQTTLSALWRKYSEHKGGWKFTGDATCRTRKTSALDTDYILIYNDERFRSVGRKVVMGDSNPMVEDRVAATNHLLCDAGGKRRCFVDPSCGPLIHDLRMRAESNTDPVLTHPTDALGYLVWHLFPLRYGFDRVGPGRVEIRRGRSVSGKEVSYAR